MEILPVRQLTMNLVAAELHLSADTCERAAAIVRQTLEKALQATPDAAARELVIEDTVKGALTALYLADNNLSHGALLVVQAVLDASAAWTEPPLAMGAALKAVADLRRFAAPNRLSEIGEQIDVQYMGAGALFRSILRATTPAS